LDQNARRFPLPPRDMIEKIGGGDYDDIGRHFLEIFRDRVGIPSTARTLDIGCGCGRMAAPLLDYLEPDTPYHGIDVVLSMVNWCRKNISTRAPNAHFHHADVFNTAFNRRGTAGFEYKLPFGEQSFDFVFLTSVFTHMNPEDTTTYLKEIYRVLAPQGIVLMTFFLMNETYYRNRARDLLEIKLDFGESPYCVAVPEIPEAVSGYDAAYALDLIRKTGLVIGSVSHGSWKKADGWTFQDVVVARRP
jgi:SAM-dependent methyltransferase